MTGTGFFGGGRVFALLLASLLLLTACDSAEERAEEHFQSGMAFLEEGDVDRALIEFRNVFKLNGEHKEARLAYARLERERGNISASFGQYLRLIEQDPDNLEGRRALAEMALETGNWEELERHGKAAAELAPDDPQIQSLNIALAYSQALTDGDTAAAAAAAEDARALLAQDADVMPARRTLIDHLVRSRDWHDALEQIDAALARDPEMSGLYAIRLSILQELDRPAEVEDQLLQMAERFPDDAGVQQLLVRHYIERDDLDAAEEFLRAEAAQAGADHLPVQRLVAFLDQYRGPGAAIDELDRIIADGGPNARRLGAMRAVLKFRVGDTDTALGEMQALLEGAERTEATPRDRGRICPPAVPGGPAGRGARAGRDDAGRGPDADRRAQVQGRLADRGGSDRRRHRAAAQRAGAGAARSAADDADGPGARAQRRPRADGRNAGAGGRDVAESRA